VIVGAATCWKRPRATSDHRSGGALGALLAIGSAGLLLANAAGAQEITPFKLTGTEGYTTLNYVSDKQSSDLPDTGRVRAEQSGWRSELFLMTHSYVYHPNLLTLDIGGGPILHSEHFLDDRGAAKASGLLYNFTARADFLRTKPYPGALYFSHLSPTVSVAPGSVMTQENDRLGLDWSLMAPVSPLPLQVSYLRARTRGRGGDRIVDDRTEQLKLSGTAPYTGLGSTQFQYQTSRQQSSSGSADLPVQASTANHQGLNLDTRLQFGRLHQYDFTNTISVDRQEYALDTRPIPTLNDTRALFDLRARHSEQARSYGYFSYGHTTQGALDTTVLDAATGLTYLPTKNTELGGALRANENRTRQFTSNARGFDVNVRQDWLFAAGIVSANYAGRLDRRNQSAAEPIAQILGERMSLTGSAYVTLSHPRVLSGSPVVNNATRTQVFVEGVDYQLVVFGNDTRIQRLAGGRILDGEQLLVDYSYDVGGTYALDEVDQTVGLTLTVSRYGSVYARRHDFTQHMVSGQPTFALNNIRSNLVGARLDYPFRLGMAMTFGGTVEHEDVHETLAPHRRSSYDTYLQTDDPVFGTGYLRGSVHHVRIDYADIVRSSDLRGYDLRYWWRTPLGIDLSAGFSGEHDPAGFLPRHRRERSFSLLWQRRRFSLSANIVSVDEAQGTFERRRTSVMVQARRDL
jgi:hypothetical protein